MNNKLIWQCTVGIVLLLIILTFTPVVTPQGVYEPKLAGLPFTFWMGFVVTTVIVVAAYVGSKYHPLHRDKTTKDD